MKKHFLTGLVILLPLTLTIAVISFIFNLVTGPYVGIFQQILHHFNLLDRNIQVQEYASQVLVVVFLVSLTIFFGMLARSYFFGYFLKLWDWLLHKIPFIGSIYKTSQEAIKTLLSSEGSFKQVVLAPFPDSKSECIGFIAKENIPPFAEDAKETMVGVFIPTALNPTSGFFVVYPESEVQYIDMKVDEAFKYLMSCGALKPPFNIISKQSSQELES